MTPDGNYCVDFLYFRYSQVLKSSFCLRFSLLISSRGFHLPCWTKKRKQVSSLSFPHPCICTLIDRFHMTSRRPCLCAKQWIGGHVCVQKKILWELDSFHKLKLSFIPSNLRSCWSRDWKRFIDHGQRSITACVAFTSLYKYQYSIVVVAGLFKSNEAFTSHFVFERETMRYSPKMVRYKIEMSWFRTWMKRFRTDVT